MLRAALLVLALLPGSAHALGVVPVGPPEDRVVRLTGPIGEVLEGCVHGGVSRGRSGDLIIDWGDGSRFSRNDGPAGASCATAHVHRYRFPGTYEVRVEGWEPGPTDAPIFYIRETTTVTVGGEAAPLPSTLALHPGALSFPFEWRPGAERELVVNWVSSVRGTVDPGVPARLRVTVAMRDTPDVVLAEAETGLLRAATPFAPRLTTLHEGTPRAGHAVLDATLRDAETGEVLAHQRRSFVLSGDTSGRNGSLLRRSVSPDGLATLTKEVRYGACLATLIDWGDGTPPETAGGKADAPCPARAVTRTFTHRYAEPGTYDVVLRYANGAAGGDARHSPTYETVRVLVPGR